MCCGISVNDRSVSPHRRFLVGFPVKRSYDLKNVSLHIIESEYILIIVEHVHVSSYLIEPAMRVEVSYLHGTNHAGKCEGTVDAIVHGRASSAVQSACIQWPLRAWPVHRGSFPFRPAPCMLVANPRKTKKKTKCQATVPTPRQSYRAYAKAHLNLVSIWLLTRRPQSSPIAHCRDHLPHCGAPKEKTNNQ